MRILKNRWFDKFARRERIGDRALLAAIAKVEAGLVDADLGSGVIKQRVARSGEGKSGGFRTILFFRKGERAVFVFGFAKKAKTTLTAPELAAFRKAARIVLDLSDVAVIDEVAGGRLLEVRDDDQNLSE